MATLTIGYLDVSTVTVDLSGGDSVSAYMSGDGGQESPLGKWTVNSARSASTSWPGLGGTISGNAGYSLAAPDDPIVVNKGIIFFAPTTNSTIGSGSQFRFFPNNSATATFPLQLTGTTTPTNTFTFSTTTVINNNDTLLIFQQGTLSGSVLPYVQFRLSTPVTIAGGGVDPANRYDIRGTNNTVGINGVAFGSNAVPPLPNCFHGAMVLWKQPRALQDMTTSRVSVSVITPEGECDTAVGTLVSARNPVGLVKACRVDIPETSPFICSASHVLFVKHGTVLPTAHALRACAMCGHTADTTPSDAQDACARCAPFAIRGCTSFVASDVFPVTTYPSCTLTHWYHVVFDKPDDMDRALCIDADAGVYAESFRSPMDVVKGNGFAPVPERTE